VRRGWRRERAGDPLSETSGELAAIAGRLALTAPSEGAGALAAGVVGLAAALCESIARGSLGMWAQGGGAAIQAAALRARATAAAADNALAYEAAREALERRPDPRATGREGELLAVLVAAADTLLTIAATGADCAGLAAEIACRCQPTLRVDAAGAAELAAAAARTAASLVDINLALLPGDARRQQANAIVAGAETARARARQAVDAS
jgi:methenyltetrahydrofolate cyclohydrolase